MKALDNEYIEQRTASIANKNIVKTFERLEKESIKIGMLKKIDILGKWYSPESNLEKDLYKNYQKSKVKKAERA